MAIPSNLYAEKIYAEHPLALWSLDEQVDYVSYLTEAQRDLSSATYWTQTGTATTTSYDGSQVLPYTLFLTSKASKIAKTYTTAADAGSTVLFTSVPTFTINGSTVSFYIQSDNTYLNSITIQVGSQTAQTQTISTLNSWVLVSKTFADGISSANTVKITLNYSKGITSSGGTANVYINGIGFGSRSEQFNGSSLGVTPTTLPSTIAYGDTYAWTGTANASTSKYTAKGITRTNLITNPSFETGVAGWASAQTSVVQSTTYALNGTNSMATGVTNSTDSNIGYWSLTLPSAGTYIYSAYFYVPVGSTIAGRTISFSPEGTITGVNVISSTSAILVAGSWARANIVFTSTSTTGYSIVHRLSGTMSTAVGQTIYTDSILLEKSPILDTYFDGSFSNTYYGIPGYQYSTLDNNAYYLASSTAMYARNSTVPMVFGASNSTIVNPAPNNEPSVIIPGYGFLNEYGKNKELTFESWFRINSSATTFRKIFGPIASTDGLYVNGPWLCLKIGSKISSHYIGEWFRPMLIQISLSRSTVSLFVNGELVASITTDLTKESTVLANTLLNSVTGKNQDWLGFYAYSDVPTLEIDGVAIYPYAVSDILAKRRFVYGQGVQYPTNLDSYYGGTSVAIDYANSGYANNYNYPDIANFSNGIGENIEIKDNYLSIPNYDLPQIVIGSTSSTYTQATLLSSNYSINTEANSFINLQPTTSWSSISSYIYFNDLNVMNGKAKSVQGVFKALSSVTDQIVFKLQNIVNGDYIQARYSGTTLTYEASFNGSAAIQIGSPSTITSGTTFAAGINFDKLSLLGSSYATFFANPSLIQVFVGGSKSSVSISSTGSPQLTFIGNIYNFGFSTARNLQKISSNFDSNGILTYTNAATMLSHTSSYKLFLNNLIGYSELDIAVNGYWQDNIAMSGLAKYALDSTGNKVMTLDSVQINLDYPEIPKYSGTNYDTSGATIKSYVTMQYLQDGANKDYLDSVFTAGVSMPKNGTTDATSFTNYYEVVNGAVVYPPTSFVSGKTIQDVSLGIHLEFLIPGIKNFTTKFKYLQLASRSLDYGVSNSIGTKMGVPLYPYTQSGTSFDYKTKNQVSIYKGSNPYMYLTNQSGIKVVGDYNVNVDRGILLNINTNSADPYYVSSIQLSMLYTLDAFPATEQQIFQINDSTGSYRFFMVASANTTSVGRIYVKKFVGGLDTVLTASDVQFYLNGLNVVEPNINIREWATLSIGFPKKLDFSGLTGNIKFTGTGTLFNNISFYKVDKTLSGQQIVMKLWTDISAVGTWAQVKALGNWVDVSTKSQDVSYALDPISIYKTFIGTNKIIADSDPYAGKIKMKSYEYAVYQNVQSTFQKYVPV